MNEAHKRFRRAYYNLFARVYDAFVALHSRDREKGLRAWLVEVASLKPGMRVLDICTGTGEVAAAVRARHGEEVTVVGADFSEGMLKKAKQKDPHVLWVQADVTNLPFKSNRFDVVLCAYGFYELKDDQKEDALREARRVLSPKGRFLMMEHEEPPHPVIRFLYRVRLATMGSLSSEEFAKREMQVISSHFKNVRKLKSPSGNSKIIVASHPKP